MDPDLTLQKAVAGSNEQVLDSATSPQNKPLDVV